MHCIRLIIYSNHLEKYVINPTDAMLYTLGIFVYRKLKMLSEKNVMIKCDMIGINLIFKTLTTKLIVHGLSHCHL